MTSTSGMLLVSLAIVALASAIARANDAAQLDAESALLRAMVHEDRELQEKRLGLSAQSPEATRAALRRAALLLDDLRGTGGVGNLTGEAAELERLTDRAGEVASLDQPARTGLYRRIRMLGRELVLKNPLVASRPILFMMRGRAVGYMLYEFLGRYYAHGNDPTTGFKNPKFPTPEPGGGVYLLERPGRTLKARELLGGSAWQGHFVTLSLSFDAKTVYFAYADPAGKDPYTRPGYAMSPVEPGSKHHTFHIMAKDADGSRPFCYALLAQPVLDRHCVRCHDGASGPDKGPPVLTGVPQGGFSKSYEGLKPYLRWPSYDAAATRPGQAGADLSPLSAVLAGEKHGKHVRVPDEDLRTLYLWLDAQVPFYGIYEEEDLAAQRLGRAVPPPPLQ